jgi:hypothetical protein
MTKNLNAFQNFQSGFSIADAMQQRNLQQEQFGLLKQKFEIEQQQEQAKQTLAMEAFNNPAALQAVYARDRELGESIVKERDKFNRLTSMAISDVLNAKPENQQEVWKNSKAFLQQRGIDTSDQPENFSPELAGFLRVKQKELRTWDDTFKTIETDRGLQRFNEKTGEITPTGYGVYRKPGEGSDGGATAYSVRKIMEDNPGMNYTQALQLYQTGFRQNTRVNDKGELEVIPGAAESKTTLKSAESEGAAFGKETGEKKALLRSMNAKMPELESTVSNLSKLGKLATYTASGKVVNETRKQLGLPASEGAVNRAEYVAVVDNQILPLMRDTFGAQFTEREGQTLRATLGDPDKTPAEKDAILKSFIKQKVQSIQSLKREVGNSQESKKQDYSEEDIQHTAKKYGVSPEEVRRRLENK